MSKYFGTDGFRGEANKTLTVEHAYKIGRSNRRLSCPAMICRTSHSSFGLVLQQK